MKDQSKQTWPFYFMFNFIKNIIKDEGKRIKFLHSLLVLGMSIYCLFHHLEFIATLTVASIGMCFLLTF